MAEIRVNTTGTLKLFDADDSHSASIKAGTLSADVASITLESGETVFNEDSADIDFRVESNGNANMLVVDGGDDDVRIGTATSFGPHDAGLKVKGDITIGDFTADSASATLGFIKSRNTTVGSQTIVANDDEIGRIAFRADDGNDANYNNNVAAIAVQIDAAPGTDDTGGRIMFETTADGARTTTERMRIHSGGVVSIPGGVELGSALDATAANTLDDYEEGTWTPAWNSGANGRSISGTGGYTKIGNLVTVFGYFEIGGSDNTGSGDVKFSGLPFTSSSVTAQRAAISILVLKCASNVDGYISGFVEDNSQIFVVREGGIVAAGNDLGNHFDQDSEFYLSASYRV